MAEQIPIYRDGRHYDAMYRINENFPQFWVDLALELGDPILELACGTGGKAIPMAQAGLTATGIDNAEAMLAEARRKAEAVQVAVEWHQADMRSFDLSRQYKTIFLLANAICHLLTYQDLSKCLACVKRHLAPDGHFVVSVFAPDLSLLTQDPELRHAYVRYADPDSGKAIVVTQTAHYDAATQIRHNHLYYQTGDAAEIASGDLPMRMYFPQELDALFEYNGFGIQHKWGDHARAPFTSESNTQTYLLKLTSETPQ